MPKSAKKSLVFLVYFALALSTIAVFWQVHSFDFINCDDPDYVSKNLHIQTGFTVEGVIWAFTTNVSANWHPLTWLSLMLDCQLFGPDPGRIHLVNVLIHIVNTLLLFAVLKKMTGSIWPSTFVAAAFALHPMHVQSVVWIAERKDVLSTFFLLLTLAAYVSYVRWHGTFRYFLTLLLFVLGLLTKPMLVTVPFLLLLLDYWPLNRFVPQTIKTSGRKSSPAPLPDRRRFLYRIIAEKIPFFALSAVSSVITFFVQRNIGAITNISVESFGQRIANTFVSYWRYIGKMFWPQNLAILYPFDIDTFPFWQITMCALLFAVITLIVLYFGRKQKYLFVGWFWFVVTLIPVIGLIQSGPQGWADRYSYIPYIGLFIIIAWGIPQLLSRLPYQKFAAGIAGVVVLAAIAISAKLEVSYWKDTTTLFSRALEVTHDNYLAHCNFANDLSVHGKFDLAIEHYRKAIESRPYYVDAILGLADAFAARGETDRAIELFHKALQLNPGSDSAAHAYNNLGIIFQKKGKLDDALYCHRKAVQLSPNSPIPANSLAWFIVNCPELRNSNCDEAIHLARRACELTEYKNLLYINTLIAAYASAGRFSNSADTCYIALKLDPSSAIAHRNLGVALLSQQKFKEAIVHFRRSLEIEPNNISAANNLAWILATCPDANLRNPSDAISFAQEACVATKYAEAGILDTLAAAYASAGNFSLAVETAQKALNLIDPNNKDMLTAIKERLDLYKASKPYIELSQKTETGRIE